MCALSPGPIVRYGSGVQRSKRPPPPLDKPQGRRSPQELYAAFHPLNKLCSLATFLPCRPRIVPPPPLPCPCVLLRKPRRRPCTRRKVRDSLPLSPTTVALLTHAGIGQGRGDAGWVGVPAGVDVSGRHGVHAVRPGGGALVLVLVQGLAPPHRSVDCALVTARTLSGLAAGVLTPVPAGAVPNTPGVVDSDA